MSSLKLSSKLTRTGPETDVGEGLLYYLVRVVVLVRYTYMVATRTRETPLTAEFVRIQVMLQYHILVL